MVEVVGVSGQVVGVSGQVEGRVTYLETCLFSPSQAAMACCLLAVEADRIPLTDSCTCNPQYIPPLSPHTTM